MIPLPQPVMRATFVSRANRFRASVLLDGQLVAAHVASSGRLAELLVTGATCYVTQREKPGRTSCVLRLVEHSGHLVSIDATMAGPLLADGLERQTLGAPFAGYTQIQREVARGRSRLDFRLSGPDVRPMWVETKSVTLVQGATALFPDAPTARGRRHLEELAAAVKQGDAASVIFVAQRDDARCFSVNVAADPLFADALVAAQSAGVHIGAYGCRVDLAGVELGAPLILLGR